MFPSALRISPLICHERNIPQVSPAHFLVCRQSQPYEGKLIEHINEKRRSISRWAPFKCTSHTVSWINDFSRQKTAVRSRIPLSGSRVQENKLVAESKQVTGGVVFLCPLPLHRLGTAGLFNVDSGTVCPDVELLDIESPCLTPNSTHMPIVDIAALKMNNKAVKRIESCGFLYSSHTGIQEGTQCTKCKNEWALKTSIALLYVLCTLLTIAVAVLGYKGKTIPLRRLQSKTLIRQRWPQLQGHRITNLFETSVHLYEFSQTLQWVAHTCREKINWCVTTLNACIYVCISCFFHYQYFKIPCLVFFMFLYLIVQIKQ